MLQFKNVSDFDQQKRLTEKLEGIFRDVEIELPEDHFEKFKIVFEESPFLEF